MIKQVYFRFAKVVVADTNPEVLDNLKKQFPEVASADAKSAAEQGIVFISLHPPVVMDMLEVIKGDVKADAVVISLAPKINLTKLFSKLSHVKNIARLIPNATSYINEGYNPVTFSAEFGMTEKQNIMELLISYLETRLKWLKGSWKAMGSCRQCFQHISGSSGRSWQRSGKK